MSLRRRPPKPDLVAGDQVLVEAHRWQDTPDGRRWAPTGAHRLRVVERLAWDSWCESWQIWSTPTAPEHPSREDIRHVVEVWRAGTVPTLVKQLDLFAAAS